MKTLPFLVLASLTTALGVRMDLAQNTTPYWSLAGNSNATTASKLGTTNNVPLIFRTNNVERLRIDGAGQVGLGIATPLNILTVKASGGTPVAGWVNPGTKPVFLGFSEIVNGELNLGTASDNVSGRAVFQGKRARGVLAFPQAVKANDYLLSFVASGYDGGSFQNPASIDFYADGDPTPKNLPGRISFLTGTNTGNRTERLSIGSTGIIDLTGDVNFNGDQIFLRKTDGNVGFGTTTPSARVDLGDPVDNTAIKFSKSGLNNGAIFSKTNTTSAVETINSDNAGFGAGISASSKSGYGVSGYSTSSIGVYGSTGGLQSNGAYAGYFSGAVNATGGYFSNSDRNLKKNIEDFSDGLAIIRALQPKHYEYKDDADSKLLHLPEGVHYGLIAQDVEKILPGVVGNTRFETRLAIPHPTEEDCKNSRTLHYKSVNYTELIPVLVKGMQEQQAIIDRQQQQIDQLERMVQMLAPKTPLAAR